MSVQKVRSSRNRRHQGRAAAAVALTLLGSACGAAGASPTKTTATVDATELSSPLADFLGVDFTGEDQQDLYINMERERNDWVQKCMAEQGFEYRAIDPSAWTNYGPSLEGPQWGSREWAETYGFGISTQMFDQVTVGSQLVGNDWSSYESPEDPNEEYMRTLTDEETNAYYEALAGNSSYDWDPSLSDEENQVAADKYFEELIPTGCDNLSYEEFKSADPWSELYTTFGDELNGMYERVQSDPEITQALADLSRCVTDKGFDYVDEQQFNEALYKRLEPVNNSMSWPGDNLTEEQWAVMTDDEMNEISNSAPLMSDEGKALLGEIQAYELEAATAAFDCGYADVASLQASVAVRYEQAFVDANKAELEAFKSN